MEDEQREAMFKAWKKEHNKKIKKCSCKEPNPSPTDKNNCFECNGEIYIDYLYKIRWNKNIT